jgi:drug/metabolite transporter (DMT)-like permease
MGPGEETTRGSRAPNEAAPHASSNQADTHALDPFVGSRPAPTAQDPLVQLAAPSVPAVAHVQTSSERSPAHHPDLTPANLPDYSLVKTALGTIRKLGTAIGSTVCFSLTGVFNQAARGETTDISKYPDPFLYCVLRSSVASVVTYLKDRESFEKTGFRQALREIGPYGHLMCGLMAVNNLLWVGAYLLTDLASALVIAGAQPFIHSLYESVSNRKLPSLLKCAGLGFTAAALGTIVQNQSSASTDYPYAQWGNLAAFAASMCFVTYMTINNWIVESARERAVSTTDKDALQKLTSHVDAIQREQALESIRSEAQRSAQERLRAVPFFSQVASIGAGLLFFIPQAALGGFSGGFGLNPVNTLIMGTLHGICTAGGLYLRTLATQTNNPSLVSLVSGAGIGLSPLFGYLLFGITVPPFAVVAGGLALCASLTSVAEVHQTEKQRQSSKTSRS